MREWTKIPRRNIIFLMVIDFHTHCFPDKLAERALASLSANIGYSPFFDGTKDGLLNYMREAGVDISVVCNIATNAKQVTAVNDFAVSLVPESGLIPFGSVHPDFPDYRAEIDRLVNAGVRGLKYHPDYQNFFVDEERMIERYEYAAEKGMVQIFHSGIDLGLRGHVHCTPDRFAFVAERMKGAKLIAAHMGGYMYEKLCGLYLRGKTELWFDTSACLRQMGEDDAVEALNAHDPDKFLFGSDLPWFETALDIEFIRSLPIENEFKEKILHKNAEAILY